MSERLVLTNLATTSQLREQNVRQLKPATKQLNKCGLSPQAQRGTGSLSRSIPPNSRTAVKIERQQHCRLKIRLLVIPCDPTNVILEGSN